MTLQQILDKLRSARRSGAEWMARCPAHQDDNASLSVTQTDDGKILLKCHAGCITESICDALGIKLSDLFPEKKNSLGKIVATYDYVDEEGKLLFQAVRYNPKAFRQRRPDGKGGWINHLDDVRRVLYNLPAVLKAETIIIVEGEKDANNVSQLGLCASCNAMGADKWRDEYSESLRGKDVVVIPDSDKPGREHAIQVAASLAGKAKSIKWLDLPEGIKDASDFLKLFPSGDALKDLIVKAPLYTPPATTEQAEQITACASPLPPELEIVDMPEGVLDGVLGECCRKHFAKFPIAYAWPAVLTAASVYVQPHERNRCNLFGALVGGVHTGKSAVIDLAQFHFRLADLNLIEETKFGSAEGLIEKIGDRGGKPVLWNPDELAHTLMKAQIENASFTMILNTALYRDKHSITVQHRKQLTANARMSIIGGVVTDRFEDCFGAETTGGLYDRFLFGLCPSGFSYLYRPIEGEPFINAHIDSAAQRQLLSDTASGICFDWSNVARPTPRIDSSVWDARDTIQRDESLEGRVLELAIRAALVCAAWDGREVLRAADLGPAWEFARYQTKVRKFLAPNPGKNYDAQASFKIREYLKAHSGDGQWYAQRDVVRATHAWEYGSATVNRAIDAMDLNGDIEKFIVKPAKGGRIKVLLRYATGF